YAVDFWLKQAVYCHGVFFNYTYIFIMKGLLKSLGLGLACVFMGQQAVAQSSSDSINEPEKPQIHFGGALRFNYNLSNWKEGQMQRGGDFGYDMFRVN